MMTPFAPQVSRAQRMATFKAGKELDKLTATVSPSRTPHCISMSYTMAAVLGLAAERLDSRLPRVVVISV